MKIFWSWQSDTPGKVARHFIRDALNAAIDQLKQAPEIDEPTERETRAAMHLDQDRKGISGSPDLARVILEKIEQAAVFVADVTPVGVVTSQRNGDPSKKVMNPNVAIELGYALHVLSDRALLMVMNEHYGNRDDLPFDLKSKAGPIMFSLPPDADRQTVEAASRQLTTRLVEALEPFIAQQVETVRQANPFPAAEARDGPARFREAGEPIGSRWEVALFGHQLAGNLNLASGAATWLRLMPLANPGRTWPSEELREASRFGNFALQPLIWSSIATLRAIDGVGCCNLPSHSDTETNSVAFAFETGEIWAIDTWALSAGGENIFVQEIERGWSERLSGYANFLGRLGLQPPYRWIAGVTGVNHRRLLYPVEQGRMRLGGWQGPECLAQEIVDEGAFDGVTSATTTLLPFFEKIYRACGISRPKYLPQ